MERSVPKHICPLIHKGVGRSSLKRKLEPENNQNIVQLNDIGICQLHAGQIEAAKQTFLEALRIQDEDEKTWKRSKSNVEPDSLAREVQVTGTSIGSAALPSNCQFFERDNTWCFYPSEDSQEGLRVYKFAMHIVDSFAAELRLLTLLYNLGQTCIRSREYEEARNWFQLSLTAVENCKHGTGHAVTVNVVKVLHNLGYCYHRLGRRKLALHHYKEALIHADKLCLSKYDVAAASNCVAVLLLHEKPAAELKKALGLFQFSLSVYVKTIGHRTKEVATCLNNIGRAHFMLAEYDKALIAFSEALDTRQKLLPPDSIDVATTQFNIFQTCRNLSKCGHGNPYEKVQNTIEFEQHNRVTESYQRMAKMYLHLRDYKRARIVFEAILREERALSTDGNAALAATLCVIGSLCLETNDIDAALDYFLEGLTIKRLEKSFDHNRATILSSVAQIYARKEKFLDALDVLNELYVVLAHMKGYISLEVVSALINIGKMNYRVEKYAVSLGCYEEALEVLRKYFGSDDHVLVASTFKYIGQAHFKLGELQSAEDSFAASMRIYEKHFAPGHGEVAALWSDLAQLATVQGDEVRAIKIHKYTLSLNQKSSKECQKEVASTLHRLGQLYEQRGELDPANLCFSDALGTLQENESSSSSVYKLLISTANIYLLQSNVSEMMKFYIGATRRFPEEVKRDTHDLANSFNRYYNLSTSCSDCAGAA